MKGRRQMPALLHQHGVALITRKHMRIPSDAPNNGSTDKHRLQVAFDAFRLKMRDAAVELAAIGIARDDDVGHGPRRDLY